MFRDFCSFNNSFKYYPKIYYQGKMKRKLIFVTSSEGKAKEAQEILGNDYVIDRVTLDLDEIQAIEGQEIAEKKAKQAFKIIQKPILVEDTSLYITAWNRLPGALIRWFLKTVDCRGICRMMKDEENRNASAETVFAYYDGKDLKYSIRSNKRVYL